MSRVIRGLQVTDMVEIHRCVSRCALFFRPSCTPPRRYSQEDRSVVRVQPAGAWGEAPNAGYPGPIKAAVDLLMALFLEGLTTAEQASVGSALDLLAESLLRPMQGLVDWVAIDWEKVNKARARIRREAARAGFMRESQRRGLSCCSTPSTRRESPYSLSNGRSFCSRL
jgi:hypothetical protein